MADIFDELLGASGVPPEELIASLRRQRNLGTVGALSGDKTIRQVGGSNMDQAMASAEGVRGLREKAEARADQLGFQKWQQEQMNAQRGETNAYRRDALKQARELADAQRANALEVARLRASGGGEGSAFNKARERKLATESVEWDTAGKVQAQGARDDISKALSKLQANPSIGGSYFVGFPGEEFVRSKLDPEGLEIQRLANRVTVENLRNTFGAQFTEKEGTQFKALDYDPALSNKQNKENLEKKLSMLDAHMRRKDELFGAYREDEFPDYASPDALSDDALLRQILAEGAE